MEEKEDLIYLRCHRLLCLQGYQGYGYDETFKTNLEIVISNLKTNIHTKVILTDYPDILCKKCPNLKDNLCVGEINVFKLNNEDPEEISINNSKIIEMDKIVLKEANLKKGKIYSFSKLILKINNVFVSKKDVQNICGTCKWIDKCLWYQSRKQSH